MTNPRKLQWIVLNLLAIFAISIYSCRKDNDDQACCDPTNPECPNYDPCYGVEEPSAEFFIEDRARNAETNEVFYYPEGEGPIVGASTRFRAKYQGDEISHTWYIGADNYFEPMVEIDFSDVTRPSNIIIYHVVEYPVNMECYPFSTGRDSVALTFQLMNYWNELKTVGNNFRGVLNNETDSFDFRIRALLPDGSEATWADLGNGIQFIRVNMHNEGDSVALGTPIFSNHFFHFEEFSRQGNLEIDSTSFLVRMEYQWTDLEDYVFKGRILE
jgi:hypothetical protein